MAVRARRAPRAERRVNCAQGRSGGEPKPATAPRALELWLIHYDPAAPGRDGVGPFVT